MRLNFGEHRCNGPEFVAHAIQDYLKDQASSSLYIAPGAPWENGYIESFNARFRDEMLEREVFGSLKEAKDILQYRATTLVAQLPHTVRVCCSSGRNYTHNHPKTFIVGGPVFGVRPEPRWRRSPSAVAR
jgi:transposase InsO family protein